jgi:hypothetical protein
MSKDLPEQSRILAANGVLRKAHLAAAARQL